MMQEQGSQKQSHLRVLFQKYASVLILVVLMGIMGVASPYFFTLNNLLTVGVQTSVNAVLALGMLMVIIVGGIDLSIGANLALSGILAAYLMRAGVPLWAALLLSISSGAVLGYINGFLVTTMKLPPFIATLGTTGVYRGVALVVTNGLPVSELPDHISWFGQGSILWIPVPIVVMAVVAVVIHYVLAHTVLGRYTYAIGSNVEATRLSGIKTARYTRTIYTIEGVLACIAGVILLGRLSVAQPTAANGYELNAIAAAVIGGASMMGGSGSVVGTIVGALIMAVLSNGFTLVGFNTFFQQLAIGVVLIFAVYFDVLQRRRR